NSHSKRRASGVQFLTGLKQKSGFRSVVQVGHNHVEGFRRKSFDCGKYFEAGFHLKSQFLKDLANDMQRLLVRGEQKRPWGHRIKDYVLARRKNRLRTPGQKTCPKGQVIRGVVTTPRTLLSFYSP